MINLPQVEMEVAMDSDWTPRFFSQASLWWQMTKGEKSIELKLEDAKGEKNNGFNI